MTVEGPAQVLQGGPRGAPQGLPAGQISVMEAARFSYRFLFERFWTALSLLWFPLLLAEVSIYACLMGYFEHLLIYLANPDPRVASLALGLLAASVFLALFFWSIAVAAITNLALGVEAPQTWLYVRARRQEWRLYAGYLRFLLLLSLLSAGLAFFLTSLGPLLPANSATSALMIAVAIIAAMFWFTARVGFLMPPIVALTSGTILRASWRKSEGLSWRICALIIVLLIPSLLVHIAAEIVLNVQNAGQLTPGGTIADYVRSSERGLSTFLIASGIASFFAITLLTAGAVAVYQRITPQRP